MKKYLNFENSASEDLKRFKIPNGNDISDTLSDFGKNIPDKNTEEEIDFQYHDPFKDIKVNDTEWNMNSLNQESDEKTLSVHQIIFNTFTSAKKRPPKLNKKRGRRYYFRKYNYKLRKFITKYADNLFRKHLLCGKIQKPGLSLLLFSPKQKKKDKNKFLSFTMKKVFRFHKRKNKKIIRRILIFIKKFDSNKKYEYIKSFLSLTIEEAIGIFEDSEEFKEFITDRKIISLDKKLQLEEGFSILQKNAYVKMLKMQSEV